VGSGWSGNLEERRTRNELRISLTRTRDFLEDRHAGASEEFVWMKRLSPLGWNPRKWQN
jgi:hypothetical protein